jgi:dsDNA-binding SOS-regulon protein
MTAGKTPTGDGVMAFYDVETDPDERQSLTGHAEARRWERLLDDERRRAADRALGDVPAAMDDQWRDELRSLGYLR